jgi:integrase
MGQLLDSLELEYTINRRRSLVTLQGRVRHLRAAFGNMRAIDVTEERIERYKLARLEEKTVRGNKPVQPATVNRELAALRRAFRLAVKQKRIAVAPSIELLEENNVRQGFIEPGDFETLIPLLPEYLQDFALFAYLTGWRTGELKSLTWADVNRDAQTILLRSENSKNKEGRLIPLPDELSEIIERRWEARRLAMPDVSTAIVEFVFHNNGYRVGDFRKSWAAACKVVGMPNLRLHESEKECRSELR